MAKSLSSIATFMLGACLIVYLGTLAASRSSAMPGSDQSQMGICAAERPLLPKNRIEACTYLLRFVLKAKQDRAVALLNRCIAYTEEKHFPLALSDCDKAVRDAPNSTLPYFNRAVLLIKMNRNNDVVADITRVLSLSPNFPQANWIRGTALARLSRLKESIGEYDKAILLKPDDAEAFVDRGSLHAKAGQAAAAEQDFARALELKPGYYRALAERCWARASTGRELRGATKDCSEALAVGRFGASILDSRALAHLQLHEYALALADYNMALKNGPFGATSLFGRGIVRFDLGQKKQGRLDMKLALTKDKNAGATFAKLALIPKG